jgi:hypothetical protein
MIISITHACQYKDSPANKKTCAQKKVSAQQHQYGGWTETSSLFNKFFDLFHSFILSRTGNIPSIDEYKGAAGARTAIRFAAYLDIRLRRQLLKLGKKCFDPGMLAFITDLDVILGH